MSILLKLYMWSWSEDVHNHFSQVELFQGFNTFKVNRYIVGLLLQFYADCFGIYICFDRSEYVQVVLI